MAKAKYYAVKKGHKIGVFESWDECREATSGFSGPDYRGFSTLEEATAYLNDENIYTTQIETDLSEGYVVAYTDGSFDSKTNDFSYGICIIDFDKTETLLCSKISYTQFAESRNIAGEIFGVLTALDWAVSNGYEKIKIYHDLESISKWATGEYNANSPISKYFVETLERRFNNYIEYVFVKVKGHSNNPYNEKADQLAASAFRGEKKVISGANSFAVDNFEKSDIYTIVELIKEEYPQISDERKAILGGEQIKLYSSKKVSTMIKIYDNKKLLVQGKPNSIYEIVLTYVSEMLGEKKIIPLVKQAYRMKIDKEALESNYANLCANVPETYSESIKTLIRQALINLNGYFEAEEYGQYAYPALRALEGHIKYLLFKHGITIDKSFNVFDGNPADGYTLTTRAICDPDKTNIEQCYNYYVKTRHKIFHFGDILGATDNTYLISSKNEADEIIKESIRLINNSVY